MCNGLDLIVDTDNVAPPTISSIVDQTTFTWLSANTMSIFVNAELMRPPSCRERRLILSNLLRTEAAINQMTQKSLEQHAYEGEPH